MFYTIYKITNKTNNKTYIGKHQTKNIDDGYMGSGNLIKKAIKKYGLNSFVKEILFVFETEAEMNAKEAELVIVSEETYNLCAGGQGGFGYINSNNLSISLDEQRKRNPGFSRKATAASKQAIKLLLETDPTFKQKLLDNLTEASKLSKGFTGKNHSDMTKKLMSYKKLGIYDGEKNSQYGSMWITNGTINKKIKNIDLIPEGWFKGRIIKKIKPL